MIENFFFFTITITYWRGGECILKCNKLTSLQRFPIFLKGRYLCNYVDFLHFNFSRKYKLQICLSTGKKLIFLSVNWVKSYLFTELVLFQEGCPGVVNALRTALLCSKADAWPRLGCSKEQGRDTNGLKIRKLQERSLSLGNQVSS